MEPQLFMCARLSILKFLVFFFNWTVSFFVCLDKKLRPRSMCAYGLLSLVDRNVLFPAWELSVTLIYLLSCLHRYKCTSSYELNEGSLNKWNEPALVAASNVETYSWANENAGWWRATFLLGIPKIYPRHYVRRLLHHYSHTYFCKYFKALSLAEITHSTILFVKVSGNNLLVNYGKFTTRK